MDDPTHTVDTPSKPPPRFRRTRIAVSVYFGVLTVALAVLWARSYQWAETVSGIDDGNLTKMGWSKGSVFLNRVCDVARAGTSSGWRYRGDEPKETRGKLRWRLNKYDLYLNFPFWFLTTLATAGAIAPLNRTRFSLRALFIATTLVAVVLGLGVWLAS